MTAPTHLTDADREALLAPCECGHDFNHHGDLAGCWTCPELEPPRECNVLGSDLMARNVEAIVQRAVTAALHDAADAIEAERRSLDKAGQISFATGCYRAERIVRART